MKTEEKEVKLRPISFTHAKYLGGIPGTKESSGALFVNSETIGVGILKPKNGVVKWSEVAGISFDSETIRKSRVGKAMLVGVFALAAKKTQDDAVVVVSLKDGNTALYEIKGARGVSVRAKMQPFFTTAGVHCLDDGVAPTTNLSVADEISKLAALRDSGIISEDEFTAHKASLLG